LTDALTLDSEGRCYHNEDAMLITESGSRLLTLGRSPMEIPMLSDPAIYP
jgi:hypothetical protein